MGDERGGHRPDAEHLSDGGLQQEELVPVTHSWCAAETYILVNFLLDLLLQLRARVGWMDVTNVLKPRRSKGLEESYCYTQTHPDCSDFSWWWFCSAGFVSKRRGGSTLGPKPPIAWVRREAAQAPCIEGRRALLLPLSGAKCGSGWGEEWLE